MFSTIGFEVGMASSSLFGTVASGEGLMCSFIGPGSVWIQTHKSSREGSSSRSKSRSKQSNPLGECIAIMIFLLLALMMIIAMIMAAMYGTPVEKHRHSGRHYISEL